MIKKIISMILCAVVLTCGMIYLLPSTLSKETAESIFSAQTAETENKRSATEAEPTATEEAPGESAAQNPINLVRSDDVTKGLQFLDQYAYPELIDSTGAGIGCLPVSMALIINYIKDMNVSPVDLCTETMPAVYIEGGAWPYEVTDCANYYQLETQAYFETVDQNAFNSIVDVLSNHQLVLLYVNNNYVHSSSHHYTVAYGINSNGEMQIDEVTMGQEEDYSLEYMQQCILSAWVFTTPPKTTITMAEKEAGYTGDPIGMDEVTVTGSSGDVTLTYYTDDSCQTLTDKENSGASGSGGEPVYPGSYYAKADITGDGYYPEKSTGPVLLNIKKAVQTITAEKQRMDCKAADLSGKEQSMQVEASVDTDQKLTYAKVKGDDCLSVDNSGRLTVAQGTAAGKYKAVVEITAAGSDLYDTATKKVKVVVKVE